MKISTLSSGKPLLKKKLVAKHTEMKENLDICYTWSIRNRNIRNFAFRQNYSTRFTEPREDYFFISSCLQEFLNNTNLLPALSADDSPL